MSKYTKETTATTWLYKMPWSDRPEAPIEFNKPRNEVEVRRAIRSMFGLENLPRGFDIWAAY